MASKSKQRIKKDAIAKVLRRRVAYIISAGVIVFVVIGAVVMAQRATSQKNQEAIARIGNDIAMAKIAQAVQTHPEPLVREKLERWYGDGTVLLMGNDFLPSMAASFEQAGGRGRLCLWFNIPFILRMPDAVSAEDKKALLWLILYHEAVHLDDHVSGRMSLMPLIPVGPVSDENLARTKMWDMEWSAVTKEWALAKKLQKPHLVPVINHFTRNGESPRSFLDGFYQLQMTGEAVKLNSALSAGFTARYKQESAKLPTR